MEVCFPVGYCCELIKKLMLLFWTPVFSDDFYFPVIVSSLFFIIIFAALLDDFLFCWESQSQLKPQVLQQSDLLQKQKQILWVWERFKISYAKYGNEI